MFSISLNEPSPMNPSYTPSFIHTQNQNISHQTHCTISWTPPYLSCIQATSDLPPVHLGYPVGGCGSVRSGLVPVAEARAGRRRRPGTCRWQLETAPTRTQPKPPNRIVLIYQITLPQLLVCIQWYHPWGCQHLHTGCWNIARAENRPSSAIVVFSPEQADT